MSYAEAFLSSKLFQSIQREKMEEVALEFCSSSLVPKLYDEPEFWRPEDVENHFFPVVPPQKVLNYIWDGCFSHGGALEFLAQCWLMDNDESEFSPVVEYPDFTSIEYQCSCINKFHGFCGFCFARHLAEFAGAGLKATLRARDWLAAPEYEGTDPHKEVMLNRVYEHLMYYPILLHMAIYYMPGGWAMNV